MRALGIATVFFSWLVAATPGLASVSLVDRQGSLIRIHDLGFQDEQGHPVRLDSCFHEDREVPVVLAFVYYGCPGVCTVVLNELIGDLQRSGLAPGRAFEAIAISIDPDEAPALAAKKKETYFARYGIPIGSPGYHFLTGKADSISEITRELGFNYERGADGNFAHPAALFFLSPHGRLVESSSNIRMTWRGLSSALSTASKEGNTSFFNRMTSICSNGLRSLGWLSRLQQWIASGE